MSFVDRLFLDWITFVFFAVFPFVSASLIVFWQWPVNKTVHLSAALVLAYWVTRMVLA